MIPLAALQSYASQVAGMSTTISCDPDSSFAPGEMGYVVFIDGVPIATIHLRRSVCFDLEHVDGVTIDPAAFLYVTHEAEHISTRSTNECDVERLAVANTWQFVRQLRLAAWRVRTILSGIAFADAQLMPQYHTGCSA